ncbi:MAG: EAL domain-containing protein [Coriobacteriales bacterium]|nr:EAL domain-containing protein [Coriobacteriales bacterium]
MLQNLKQFLAGQSLEPHKAEVARQNRLAIRYFAAAGIPVGIANIIAQTTVKGAVPTLSQRSVWLFLYFCALFLLERLVIPIKCKNATLLAYALEAPVFIVTILLGTVWDPDHQAMTFLMFMLVMPIFILDKPGREMGVLVGWNALFLTLCVLTKNPDTLRGDFSHTLEFLLLALAVTYVVLKLRIEVMEGFAQTRYNLEHDTLTNTRNKRKLEDQLDHYVGKSLFVAVGDIDHLALINDLYGNERGDEVVLAFANVLKDEFTKRHVYRFGGDDMLCIAVGASDKDGLGRIAASRKRLAQMHNRDIRIPVTYTFGYTTGVPRTAEELYQMIQLASINTHLSMSKGEGLTLGTPFSQEALRVGIGESNLTGHATSYEINQITGLPGVPYFVARSEELVHHKNLLQKRPTVVGYLKLTDFRGFNEEFGYVRGDDLLRYIASLLRDALPHRHVAYISGSRFAVLCHMDEVEPAMASINDELTRYKPGHPLCVRAGFAQYREGDAIISLLDKAKLAYESLGKQDGRTYRVYDDKLDEEVRIRQHLVTHLDQAINQRWIKVHYQPVVCTGTQSVCSLEALSRWDDPVYGLLPPLKFISVLERERLIYKLSLFVIEQVIRDMRHMRAQGLEPIPVSINLSRNDFFSCDIVREIERMADEGGVSHDLLCFELTESAFASDQDRLKHEIDSLRSKGFAVWMDDFGSEYSTLSLLQELNFDVVKIDMRFMEDFHVGSRNATIVESVLTMCRRLGVGTLVEGVETREQSDLLHEMECDKLQGYLYSPPRPFTDIVAMARTLQQRKNKAHYKNEGSARSSE